MHKLLFSLQKLFVFSSFNCLPTLSKYKLSIETDTNYGRDRMEVSQRIYSVKLELKYFPSIKLKPINSVKKPNLVLN